MSRNPKSEAREFAVQFLYQSESERLFHFSEPHFQTFVQHLHVAPEIQPLVLELVRGTLDQEAALDRTIQEASSNWKLSRMSIVDRNVLRLATYELTDTETPHRVVINEAIELAKKFGSAESARFVNGVLDRIAKTT